MDVRLDPLVVELSPVLLLDQTSDRLLASLDEDVDRLLHGG